MPPPEIIAPGISLENLKRLTLESPEGRQFGDTLRNYFPVFHKKDSWQREWNSMPKGGTTRALARENKPDRRWSAVFVDCMNKRQGTEMNTATLASYTTVIGAIKNLAGSVYKDFNASNTDFSMAPFINCCLDRMGVEEAAKLPDLPPTAVRATDYAGLNLSALDPKINTSIVEEMKRNIKAGQDPAKPNDDLTEIAKSDRATRLFIGGQQDRILALTIRYFERMIGGPLMPDELAFAGKVYTSLKSLSGNFDFPSQDANFSFYDFVSQAIHQIYVYEAKHNVKQIQENNLTKLVLKPDMTGGTFWFNDIQYRLLRRGSSSNPQFVLATIFKQKSLTYDQIISRYKYMIYSHLETRGEYKIPNYDSPLSIRMSENDELLVFVTDRYRKFFYNANHFSEKTAKYLI